MTDRYLADESPSWKHPKEHPPPLGTKMLLLTRGGVAVIGNWDVQVGAVAWCPLPKVDPLLKETLAQENPGMC